MGELARPRSYGWGETTLLGKRIGLTELCCPGQAPGQERSRIRCVLCEPRRCSQNILSYRTASELLFYLTSPAQTRAPAERSWAA